MKLIDIPAFSFGLMLGGVIGYGACMLSHKEEKIEITTPVEKEVIDTLYITRDSLITKTNYIETIKHDTIEKVYKLDDSTTIKLFYQLVSE